jgi:GNAT superfamily N-acetyltransferase
MNEKLLIGDIRIQELQRNLGANTWPELIQHDEQVNYYWPHLYDEFLDVQFALFDDEKLVGIGNAMHLNWQQPFEELPEGGVRWAMKKATREAKKEQSSNLLVAMQILIEQAYRNQGMSYKMVNIMKQVASAQGIDHVALPVRPTLKSKFPLIPMEEYITWVKSDGLPFDPWLRVHLKLGGKIVSVCSRSMYMEGTPLEWEEWSGMQFPGSGQYIVDRALNPITIDLQSNIGTYVEPNVWVIHKSAEV